MKLSAWESKISSYTYYEYRSDDNVQSEMNYISYAFRFNSINVVSSYPSVIALKSAANSPALSFWHIRGVFVVFSTQEYDLVKCVCCNPNLGRKGVKSLFFRAYKN